jgi:hypothetical protein
MLSFPSLCRIFKSASSAHRRGNPSIDPNNDRLCRATAAATWLSAAMSCLLPTYQKAFVHAFGGLSSPAAEDVMLRIRARTTLGCQRIELGFIRRKPSLRHEVAPPSEASGMCRRPRQPLDPFEHPRG